VKETGGDGGVGPRAGDTDTAELGAGLPDVGGAGLAEMEATTVRMRQLAETRDLHGRAHLRRVKWVGLCVRPAPVALRRTAVNHQRNAAAVERTPVASLGRRCTRRGSSLSLYSAVWTTEDGRTGDARRCGPWRAAVIDICDSHCAERGHWRSLNGERFSSWVPVSTVM